MLKILFHCLLGICGGVCLYPLVMAGFAFPVLPDWINLLLRIGAAVSFQWLLLRLTKKNWLRFLPLLLSSLLAVWGFFLLLSAPSWRNATVSGFFAEYASPMISCLVFLALYFLIPPSIYRLRRYLKKRRRRKQKAKEHLPPKQKKQKL